MQEPWCNYCTCPSCQNGWNDGDTAVIGVEHARTANGDWVCSTCFDHDICAKARKVSKETDQACYDETCKHKPEIVSEWSL